MLYRFRETQAVDMGMGDRQKGERRPRMASSVTNLRDCERWRGDIMRDISRKVSKIQDCELLRPVWFRMNTADIIAGLTDYQIRDLNDEINNLLREKRHFETQIVNLGGANYKRGNASMLDDEGKEVPGTRGYKYFGRAKELPGVKEMFSKSSTSIVFG
jgi:pre-mRNA-splicing factor ISY1